MKQCDSKAAGLDVCVNKAEPSETFLFSFFCPAATTAEPAWMGITGTAASAPRASPGQTVGSVSINADRRSSLIPV